MRKIICIFLAAFLFATALTGCDPYKRNQTEPSRPAPTEAAPTTTLPVLETQASQTQTIPQEEHIHSYFGVPVNATCTDGGYMLHSCGCGDSFVDTETPALGHDWASWEVVQAPTETTEGLQTRSCSRCNASDSQALSCLQPDHTHSYLLQVIEPDCTQEGYTHYSCVCGDAYTDLPQPALGHSFTAYISNQDSTCTTDGTKTAICDRCTASSTISDAGSATGHAWGNWIVTKEPTATDYGVESRSCTNCGATDSRTVDPIPAVHTHSYTAQIIAPTCTEDGYTLYTCSCGDQYRNQTVAAAGHTWGEWVVTKEPTVTSEGQKTRSCKNCAATDSYVIERLPAVHEHSYEKEKVAATCMESGYVCYTCECGDSYTETTTEPKGHNWENWYVTVDATLTTAGQRERNCTDCGAKETGSTGLLQKVGGFVFVYWSESIGRNMEATVIIKGQPGVTYKIEVIYASGISTAKGLEKKVADENGYVTWNWKIGPSTAAGTYRIRVSGGDDKQTVYFAVVVGE